MSADEHRTHSIHGHVVRVSAEPKTAAKGGYLFRGLELVDGSGHRVFVIFPVFSGDDHYEFPLLCWEGARIAAYDLEFNNELEDGSVIYGATPESEFILEPYRPISVTEAVDAAACIRSVDCRYRVGPEEPFWMAKGKLIHSLFEHLVHGGDKPSGRIFHEAFQKALPGFMAVLPGSSITAHHKAVEEDARAHFSNLKLWLKNNIAAFISAEVETDRISSRLGLKGRADAIFHNGNRKMILELKSGKIPVEDHFLQLFAYSLLFSSDGSSSAEGYILYSATGNAEKLNQSGNRRRIILQGRNRAVALKHSYTVDGSLLAELKCPRNGRCFSRSACTRLFGSSTRNQSALFGGVERRYYDRWFRLLSLDGWCQEGEFSRMLDPESLAGRIDERITIPIEELKILDQLCAPNPEDELEQVPTDSEIAEDDNAVPATSGNRMTGQLRTKLQLPDQTVELTPGEEIILHRGDLCSEDAFRGRVFSLDDKTVTVDLKVPFLRFSDSQNRLVELPPLKKVTGWFVDRVPFSRGREIARHALFGFFARGSSRVIHAVVHGEQVDPDAASSESSACQAGLNSEESLTDLNADQQTAVKAALDCDVYHLVHGPPGTGKTRVLAHLIRLCLDRGERVLVACPTNVALDRLLMAVMNLGVREFLRVGVRGNVSREFLQAIEKLGNPPVLLPDFAFASSDFRAFKKHISEVKLIGATAYQSAAHPLFLRKRFDRVIVDEAGQLDEPATLGPLTLAPKFVLGGDHLQLPPVVKMKNDNSNPETEAGLERSLFERLYSSSSKTRISPLNMQYRMNLEVQDIPSRIFYDGALFPSPGVANRRLRMSPLRNVNPIMDRIIDPQVPVVFVNVEGKDSGKARPEEALAAGTIVRNLLACGVPAHEIGIITPYRAQQSLIRRGLHDLGHSARHLSVDTVDRFQGGEREVILVSLARSDSVTSFLADRKRLNVSLSRARSKLILLGYGNVLREHELFDSILKGLDCITFNPH